MAEILIINGANVKIGEDDGKVITVPIAALQYANPKVGDQVDVFRDSANDSFIVRKSADSDTSDEGERSVNKHVFVWVGCFLFGCLGVDRFMRGQVGLGILKLAACLMLPVMAGSMLIMMLGGYDTVGLAILFVALSRAGWIWALIDWIVGLVKVYGSAYGASQNVTFDGQGKYVK